MDWTLTRQIRQPIPDTGRHGVARIKALTTITYALGGQAQCREPLTGYRQRTADRGYLLTLYGPKDLIDWLEAALPAMLGHLDQAAATATRRYAVWLREGCPDTDHMPAERPSLRASWRRRYLVSYGEGIAARIRGTTPQALATAFPGGRNLYWAHQA